MINSKKNTPLFVDLDGTLLKTDILFEEILILLKRNIFYCLSLLFWLARGRAYLKFQLSKRVDIPVETLPVNTEFLKYLHMQKKENRELILISGSNQKAVDEVNNHMKLFDSTFGSDENINLTSRTKLKKIEMLTKGKPFSYAGNSREDTVIWNKASQAVIVNCKVKTINSKKFKNTLSFDPPEPALSQLFRSVRPHQWLKNLLVFIPLILSHQLSNTGLISDLLITFISFSLCASSVYLMNDLFDLSHDRNHLTKFNRPFASGSLSVVTGLIAAPCLFVLGAITAFYLPINFLIIFFIYGLINFAYSFYLKNIFMLDVVILAFLYTLRIMAGAESIELQTTSWLLGFSFSLFLGLALVKRVAELFNIISAGKTKIEGRAYHKEHMNFLKYTGIFSSAIAIGIFAFYITDPKTTELYAEPLILWAIFPLISYLLFRIWKTALKGEMSEDPVLFALTDHIGQIIVACCGVILWLAS